jgi:sulfatase maturation enzyme AslB (radical SAM superfamily)
MTLVVTTRCNLACSYCFQQRTGGESMSWSTLRAAFELLGRGSGSRVEIGFTGGEPLLALGLVERALQWIEAHWLPDHRPQLLLSTNGLLLDERAVGLLIKHGVDTRLSFDGLAQELRAPGTFDQLERTVRRLQRSAPALMDHLSVTLTLTADGLSLLADSVAYLIDLGVREVVVSPISTHDPGWAPESRRVLDRQLDQVFAVCLSHFETTGARPLSAFRPRPERRSRGSVCSAGDCDRLLVDVDGSLAGCTRLAESYQLLPEPWRERLQDLRLGRLGEDGLEARRERARDAAYDLGLFHHPERKYTSYGRCSDCQWLPRCFVCPMASVHIPGNTDPHRLPDNQCAWNRAVLPRAERFPRAPSALDVLTGNAPLPTAMTDLLAAFGREE